jgi:hypothetical protein
MIGLKYKEGLLGARLKRLESGDFTGVMTAGGQVVVKDLVRKIQSQQRADEKGPLERNDASTIARKEKKGQGSLSLIAGRKALLNPGSYSVKGNPRSCDIELNERPTDGYWWHNTKYKWFEISNTAKRKVKSLFLDAIRKPLGLK